MKVRNRPTPDGRELGKNMARFADVEEANWKFELGFYPVRCPSCAFKKGTIPNGCVSTTMDATKCTLENVPFFCHYGERRESLTTLCAGYLLLRSEHPIKVDWPFSDEMDTGTSSTMRKAE